MASDYEILQTQFAGKNFLWESICSQKSTDTLDQVSKVSEFFSFKVLSMKNAA